MSLESGRIEPSNYSQLQGEPLAELVLDEAQQTRRLGHWLAARCGPGDFVGLVGDLGAGKTTLMQGLVTGADDEGRWEATSPTYSLIQIYETSPPIYHMDLYRLEGWADLESIGYWDYVEDRRGIACVEWLDRIPGAWPGHGVIVELFSQTTGRGVRLWGDDAWKEKIETFGEAKGFVRQVLRGRDEKSDKK